MSGATREGAAASEDGGTSGRPAGASTGASEGADSKTGGTSGVLGGASTAISAPADGKTGGVAGVLSGVSAGVSDVVRGVTGGVAGVLGGVNAAVSGLSGGLSGADHLAAAGDRAASADAESDAPILTVVSGRPTDEELAALTAVVVALQAEGAEDDSAGQARSWVRRALLRLGPTPGPGSWRRSSR